LNPRWCADYLKYLQDFVGQNEIDRATSHIVFTTHNPLAIAELVKQQVQILKRDEESKQVIAYKPELDPRGMGYAGIVSWHLVEAAASHQEIHHSAPSNTSILLKLCFLVAEHKSPSRPLRSR
jgi:hypothetical protein